MRCAYIIALLFTGSATPPNVYPMSTNVYLMSFYVGVLPGPPLR